LDEHPREKKSLRRACQSLASQAAAHKLRSLFLGAFLKGKEELACAPQLFD
jgi:hypothetical protein